MSFYFAYQSNNKLKLGHSKSNKKSLQLSKSATSKHSDFVTNNSVLSSPMIQNQFVTLTGKDKRAFLSTHLKGSITVEASLILPIFIFTMISIMYFFNILYIHTTMQMQLENTARLINSYTCITSGANINLNDDENSLLEKVIVDAAGTVAVKSLFITDEIKAFADNSLIVDGSEGLSFLGSDVTNTDYDLNIILSYDIQMPFISEDIFTFSIKQNCFFKPFTGKRLSYDIPLDESYVYVTQNGSSFHENEYCSYLERCSFVQNLNFLLDHYPNITPCTLCSKDNPIFGHSYISSTLATYVYVTKEYDVYHYVEACPHLEHNVIMLPYDEAREKYQPCSRCSENTS